MLWLLTCSFGDISGAWCLGKAQRTKIRWSHGLEYLFWVAYMFPTLSSTIGWMVNRPSTTIGLSVKLVVVPSRSRTRMPQWIGALKIEYRLPLVSPANMNPLIPSRRNVRDMSP